MNDCNRWIRDMDNLSSSVKNVEQKNRYKIIEKKYLELYYKYMGDLAGKKDVLIERSSFAFTKDNALKVANENLQRSIEAKWKEVENKFLGFKKVNIDTAF